MKISLLVFELWGNNTRTDIQTDRQTELKYYIRLAKNGKKLIMLQMSFDLSLVIIDVKLSFKFWFIFILLSTLQTSISDHLHVLLNWFTVLLSWYFKHIFLISIFRSGCPFQLCLKFCKNELMVTKCLSSQGGVIWTVRNPMILSGHNPNQRGDHHPLTS